MPMFKRADAEIHYAVHGSGFPILLYAPGGLKSQMDMWGGESAAYPNGFPGWIRAGARRQVHRGRHGPAQCRQVGRRREARPWLAHLRGRPLRADGPSGLRQVPCHGRLHRRQLLLRGDRARSPTASPRRCCRTRSACGRTATPGTPRSRATARRCAAAIRRSARRPSSRSATTCSAPTSCSPSRATS